MANVGIELDRPLEVRNRFETRHFAAFVERERVGMERVERRRRRPRQRHVELLDGCERFAQLLTQPRGRSAERRQHLLLAGRFGLLARHHVAGLGVDGFEREHVVASETGDRAGEQRLELFAPRNLARKGAGEALVRRALHQSQGLSRTVVWKHLQKRRLLQRHRQRHFERAVEDRLAGCVFEVGQDDRVLLGQRAGPWRDEI